MTLLDFTLRIVLAVGLGAVIGIERQYRQRGAGLRTNALVAMGAAAFVTLSFLLLGEQSPTRIAAQVVSGIGFLGGGIILREGLNVRGTQYGRDAVVLGSRGDTGRVGVSRGRRHHRDGDSRSECAVAATRPAPQPTVA